MRGFTLVELIVVITILAIGTIAFITLNDFNKDARYSARETEVQSFARGIEMYATTTGNYPVLDNAFSVTDSGDEVTFQGIAGDLAAKNARVSENLTDPLTGENYEYSVSGNGLEYEVKYTVESLSAGIVKNAYASELKTKIIGRYNGLFATSKRGKFVSMPSLFVNLNGANTAVNLASDSLNFTVEGINIPVAFVPQEVDKTSPTTLVTDLKKPIFWSFGASNNSKN